MTNAREQQGAYREWPARYEGRSVCVGEEAARDLEARVTAGVKALRKRGLEIGGLLVGTLDREGMRVESLWPVESEYPEGPVYRVTEEQLAAAVKQAEEHGLVIGMYRSRTDGKLELDQQDYAHLGTLAADWPFTVLLVRQTLNVPGDAMAGVWRHSGIQWLGAPKPLRNWWKAEAQGEVQSPEAVQHWNEAPAEPAAPALPETLKSRESGTAARSLHGPKLTRVAAAVLIALAGAGAWLASRYAAEPAEKTVASRKTPGVSSRLPADLLPASRAAEREPSLTPAPSPAAAKAASSSAAPPLRQPKPPVTEVQEAPAQVRARTASRFQLPPARTDRARPGDIAVAGAPPPVQTSTDLSALRSLPIAPPPRLLVVPGPNAALEYTPPVVARQAGTVVLPPDIRRLLQYEAVVEVKVSVDQYGAVRSVAPAGPMGKVEQALWRTYSTAIRSWEFEPARRNGKAVAADTILRFRVQP